MKKLASLLSATVGIAFFWGCSQTAGRYIDLSTGKAVEIEKDEKTGYMVNEETNEPLYIYVDTKTNDTIYGKTGKIINGHLYKNDDQKWVYDEDEKLKMEGSGEVKYKDDDYKVKVEKDGDMKIKDGDRKVKVDAEEGEIKKKND